MAIRSPGRVVHGTVTSEALRGNPLGDPHERPVRVHLPPGHDDGDQRYPTIVVIQGYTGQLAMWDNRTPWRPTFPELVDELFADPAVPPCIVVLVDAWTRYGGSQYVDSPGTGDYLTYLCDDVVGWVDANHRTIADRDHRALAGKSSGGYGAMTVPMRRPDVFGAFATHAGDALFEVSYLRELGQAARALRDHFDGSWETFLADVARRPALSHPADGMLLELYGVSAAWSADPDGTVRVPFDARTGRLDDALWARWLANDPVRMAPDHADALRSMRAVWVDAGTRDEYFLDLGATAFHDELDALGVEHHFELFDAAHAAIEYRYPLALRHLAERIAPA